MMTEKIFKTLFFASTVFHKKKQNLKNNVLTFFILEKDYFLLTCNPFSVARFVS